MNEPTPPSPTPEQENQPSTPVTTDTPANVSADDKTMGMLAHLLGIVSGFVGALIIWLIKKEQGGFAVVEAKEALNFQLTVAIICVALGITILGAFLIPVVWLAAIVFSVIGGMKANEAKNYRYPFAIRLIK